MAKELFIGAPKKKITLTNLIPSMDSLTFGQDDIAGPALTMSSTHTKYNSVALQITGDADDNEKYAVSTSTFTLNPEHIYYACVEAYQEERLGSIDLFWPAASPSFIGGRAVGNAGQWNKYYMVGGRSSFTAGNYSLRLDFNNGGVAGNIWFDGVMIIDLTEAFGAGNEPEADWCSENISYSTGTFSIELPSDGTARKAIDIFIGKDGIAKRVKEVFIGINGIAKKFYSVEMVEINILNELEGAEIIINGISYTKAQTIKTIKGTNITARIGETDLTENKIYFNGSSVINNVGGGEVEYIFKAEKSYKIDYSAGSTKHYMHIDEINLINFTIEGVSYQAEEGMTWLDWINSKYNIDGYYQNGSVTNIVYAPQENYGFTVGYIDTELIEDGDTISLRDISNVSIEK